MLRQAGAERRVRQLGEAADEHRPVADVRVAVQVLDHLGVVVGAQLGLARVAVRVDRQEADDVGQERVRRDLALGILVQEVVDLPRLVADPQVVGRLAHDVVEEHVVRAEDLVHPAERVEGVQVVVAGLALPVGGLGREVGAGRVHDLALGLEHRRHRRLGQPLDLQVGHRARAATARSRGRAARGPSPIGEHTHSARRLRSRANSQVLRGGAGGGVHVDELLDQVLTRTGCRPCGRCPRLRGRPAGRLVTLRRTGGRAPAAGTGPRCRGRRAPGRSMRPAAARSPRPRSTGATARGCGR